MRKILDFYRLNWPLVLFIVVIAVIAYAAVLPGQFLSADDIPGIVQNQELRNFSATVKSLNLNTIFSSIVINTFGVSPVPFHVILLMVHILNALLVLLLAYTLFGKRPALYASLIFCLLPTGSEAVFWISGMTYIFQAFFSLLCITLFFLFRSTKEPGYLISSGVTYLVALILLQSPWLLTVPFILVVVDIFTFTPFTRREHLTTVFKARWCYFIYVALAAGFWLVWLKSAFSSRVSALTDYYFNPGEPTALLKRAPYTIYKAVELYIFPWRLSFFHEEVLTKPIYIFMVTITVATAILIIYLIYKRSKYAGLMLAILASILPTLSPVQVAWFIAERYLYLGGAFFAMLVALLIIRLDYKYSVKNLALGILIPILLFYSVRLVTRAQDFSSSKALWLATQKTAPTSYRVYNNLGDVYSNDRNWEKAIASFKMAVALAPDYADAIHNLGYTYMLMGDYDNAKKYLLESYQKNGRLWQALEKLGQIELKQGNNDKAREYFEEVRKANPAVVGLPNI